MSRPTDTKKDEKDFRPYFKTSREHFDYLEPTPQQLFLYQWICGKIQHRDRSIPTRIGPIKLRAGEFLVVASDVQKILNIPKSSLNRYLSSWSKLGITLARTGPMGSIIRVLDGPILGVANTKDDCENSSSKKDAEPMLGLTWVDVGPNLGLTRAEHEPPYIRRTIEQENKRTIEQDFSASCTRPPRPTGSSVAQSAEASRAHVAPNDLSDDQPDDLVPEPIAGGVVNAQPPPAPITLTLPEPPSATEIQHPASQPDTAKPRPKRPADPEKAAKFDRQHWCVGVYAAAKARWSMDGFSSPFPAMNGKIIGTIGRNLEALGGADLRRGAQKLLAALDASGQNFSQKRDPYWLPTVANVFTQDKIAQLLVNIKDESIEEEYNIPADPLDFEDLYWQLSKDAELDRLADLAPQRPQIDHERAERIRIAVEKQKKELYDRHMNRVRMISNSSGLCFDFD